MTISVILMSSSAQTCSRCDPQINGPSALTPRHHPALRVMRLLRRAESNVELIRPRCIGCPHEVRGLAYADVRKPVHSYTLMLGEVCTVLGVQGDRDDFAIQCEPRCYRTRRRDVDDPKTMLLSHLRFGIRLLLAPVQIRVGLTRGFRGVPPPYQDVVRSGIEHLTLRKDDQRSIKAARELVHVVQVRVVNEGARPLKREAISERVARS